MFNLGEMYNSNSLQLTVQYLLVQLLQDNKVDNSTIFSFYEKLME